MAMAGSRVLVTGAGGFIGSHLAESLVNDGCEVRAMVHYNARSSWGNLELVPAAVRDRMEVVYADITDPFSVRRAVEGCEVVYHLAALIAIPYSYVAPQSYVQANVMGTLNVLQACRELNVRKMVHTSTSEAYGSALYTPMDEKHPLQGQSPYSASKIGADKLAESYYRSFKVPVATIRPFNTFGPRQSARAIIPTIIAQILNGNETIRLGSLFPIRDLTFVLDTVAGFKAVAASEASSGEVINVGRGSGISVGDLAKLIADLMGREVRVECDQQRVRPEASEVDRLISDPSKAKQLLGWTSRFDLSEGLRQTIAFMTEHHALYKSEMYNT
jgi:NAD dependent epimerase/dehydratase